MQNNFKNRLLREKYIKLCRLDKPVGTLLLLWPTLWALFFAKQGFPSLKLLFIFVSGTFLTRTAGCIFNDIADRHFDKHVARTRDRPVTTGRVSVPVALSLGCILLIIAFILVCCTNLLTVLLSMIAAALMIIYPYTKRFFQLPQAVLGITFSFGIPMAYAAVLNHIPAIGWVLFFCCLCWVVMYDTQYALVDREDDLKVGLNSSAILFGSMDRVLIGVFQCAFLFGIAWIGLDYYKLSLFFFLSLWVVAGSFIYQHYLIRHRIPQRCLQAFSQNHWIGFVVFLGIFFSF